MTRVYCADCKHHKQLKPADVVKIREGYSFEDNQHTCALRSYDIVTGKGKILLCREARNDSTICGPTADRYESK